MELREAIQQAAGYRTTMTLTLEKGPASAFKKVRFAWSRDWKYDMLSTPDYNATPAGT
jgi:hypothetical protein